MARKYDASRRSEAARRTREQIIATAFRQHGEGIIDTEALAREADVSVATVRKHFPTREVLFENCTAYGVHLARVPDLAAIAAVEDPVDRTRAAVADLHRFYEALLGQMWSAYRLAGESPTLARLGRQRQDLVATLTGLILAAWPEGIDPTATRGAIVGLLSPLTYRAMRVEAGLSPEATRETLADLLLAKLSSGASGREAAL
jgi:AcrR family transcriptional regulator